MNRLKAALSHARQSSATRDATRDNQGENEVSHVAFLGFATRDSHLGVAETVPGRLKPLCRAAMAHRGDTGSNLPSQEPDTAHTPSVIRLRLTLQQDDGERVEAILAIPTARYDGMRVLELFEQHRMAGTTRVISVLELDECPETIGR
jgi:hypothetical protein